MTQMTVRIPAKRYEDEDDCLSAAARDYAHEHDLVGWDLAPRWEDDQRDAILLTVPQEGQGQTAVLVTVTLPDGRAVTGEVTLLPAADGRPVYEAWGEPSAWVEEGLLRALRTAYPARRDFRAALEEVEAMASAQCGRPEPE
jgi:hypothetical protein